MPYLDHAATTPLRPEAAAMLRALLDQPVANPASPHRPGRAARSLVETARDQVAALVGASPDQVVFTSGGTESDNLAVKGTLLAREPGRRHAVISAVEHHAVLDAADGAAADHGAQVDHCPVDRTGRLLLDELDALLRPGMTALVAVMAANNEVGTVQPVAAAATRAHAAGAFLLCDAVQAAGVLDVDITRDGIDLLAITAHKLGGPPGVGALVVGDGPVLRPLLHGGGHERGRRSGTLPAALLAAFGAAADAARSERGQLTTRLCRLRDQLRAQLTAAVPNLEVNGAAGRPDTNGEALPGLLSVRLPGMQAEDLLLLLDRAGISCSTGAACASGAAAPSHVLRAMGRTPAQARETLRFSLGHDSTAADVDAVVTALSDATHRLNAHA